MVGMSASASAVPLFQHLTSAARGMLWWQWLALPCLALGSIVIGYLVSWIAGGILGRIAARTAASWDDILVDRARWPMRVCMAIVVIFAGLPTLELGPQPAAFVARLLRTAIFLVFFWTLVRGLDVLHEVVITSPWTQQHPAARALLPVGRRILKVMVWVVAVLSFLADFGFPVASILAGLGIGGLAFALAGQKTVEHLFGAVAIGLDQPLRVGDFVRIEDFVGTVEAIGVRSTRIRTLDRTIITIPNGKLAEMRIETFAVRDRIRFSTTLGLVYETTQEQMRQILDALEKTLRAQPLLWPDAVSVRFSGFGASSLNVDVMAWFLCDWDQFMLVRQELLLQFMAVVEEAGSSFAFPSQTVYLAPQGVAAASG